MQQPGLHCISISVPSPDGETFTYQRFLILSADAKSAMRAVARQVGRFTAEVSYKYTCHIRHEYEIDVDEPMPTGNLEVWDDWDKHRRPDMRTVAEILADAEVAA